MLIAREQTSCFHQVINYTCIDIPGILKKLVKHHSWVKSILVLSQERSYIFVTSYIKSDHCALKISYLYYDEAREE